MHLGDALHWFHMWDYDPPPYAQNYVCLYIVLLPYIDDVLVVFMGMYGGRMGRMHVPYGMETLYASYATCFKESIGPAMVVSFELLSPYGMDYLNLMRNLEEKFMEVWIGEHLAYGGILSHIGVTNGGREDLHHSPCQFLEDKQHLGGEDCNIPN